jgi:hypothetical protein
MTIQGGITPRVEHLGVVDLWMTNTEPQLDTTWSRSRRLTTCVCDPMVGTVIGADRIGARRYARGNERSTT